MSRPRVLLVSFRVPYPLNAGFKLRAYHMARLLSRRYDVDLLTLDEEELSACHRQHLETIFRHVTVVRHDRRRAQAQALLTLPTSMPLQIGYYRSRRLKQWIARHHRDYDLVFGFHLRTAPYLEALSTPTALDFIDAASLFYEGAQAYATGLWQGIYRVESRRARIYEGKVLPSFEKAFVSSPYDAARLGAGSLGGDGLTVLPNGVREQLLREPIDPESEAPALAFLGKMDYAPNVDAAVHFARDVFPQLRLAHPELAFWVIGTRPRSVVAELASQPGVWVTGHVDDPFALLKRAQLVVVPLRYAAGIQNKILEAMALGKAVLTTEAGVRGIEGEPGRHYEVVPDHESWEDRVQALLEDPDRRRRVGEQARALVAERYRWDRIGDRLLAEVDPLVAS